MSTQRPQRHNGAPPTTHIYPPQQRTVGQILADKARGVIARLPDVYRDAFVLRDLEEMSTADVAKALGVEPATVRQRVHRARLMLRGYLSDLVRVKP